MRSVVAKRLRRLARTTGQSPRAVKRKYVRGGYSRVITLAVPNEHKPYRPTTLHGRIRKRHGKGGIGTRYPTNTLIAKRPGTRYKSAG